MKITEVQNAVVAHFNTTVEEVIGRGQNQTIVKVRHIAWYLERKQGRSFPEIGAYYNRDHTSIIAGCKHMEERIAVKDERYTTAVETLREKLERQAARRQASISGVRLECPTCGTSVLELQRQIAAIHRRLDELGVKS